MNAPTVYDIVVDDGAGVNGEYVGTLFGGIKFFLHQQVPSRSALEASIKVNGGKIVRLEKHADVRIGDHARKNVPPGFVSWKYVQDSIAGGELCNIDDYKIGTSAPRPVGSAQPTRATRNPFTAEEDRQLTEYVLQKTHEGRGPTGNKVFEVFAEQFPSHTWQSWRDRWVKKLRPAYEGRISAGEASPSPALPAVPKLKQPNREVRSKVSPISDAGADHAPRRIPGARSFFTPEDDRILRQWVEKRVSEGGRPNGNVIYQELEEEYPHHTFHSWRDRWIRHLSKHQVSLNEAEPKRPRPSIPAATTSRPYNGAQYAPQVAPPLEAEQQPTPTKIDTVSRMSTQGGAEATDRTRNQAQHPRSRQGSSFFRSPTRAPASGIHERVRVLKTEPKLAARFKELEEKREKVQAARLIQRIWRGYHARRVISSAAYQLDGLSPLVRGTLKRRELKDIRDKVKSEPDEAQSDVQESAPKLTAPEKPVTKKEEFYKDIQMFYAMTGAEPIPWVEVGNRALDLWDLWHAVTTQSEYRDWEEIAESLGIDWVAAPRVTHQLKAAFEKHLLEFEQVMATYSDRASESPDQGENGEASGAGARVPSEEFISSPPVVAGQKRSYGEALLPSTIVPPSPRKRRRHNTEDEIPYTPDKPSQNTARGPDDVVLTTPLHIRMREVRSSPQQLPGGSVHSVEPETQDFQFQIGIEGEERWDTPSHQLLSENHLAIRSSQCAAPRLLVSTGVHHAHAPQAENFSPSATASSENSEFPPIEKITSLLSKQAVTPPDVDSDSDEYFATPVRKSSERNPVRRSLPWKTTAMQPPSSTQQPVRRSAPLPPKPATMQPHPQVSSSTRPKHGPQGGFDRTSARASPLPRPAAPQAVMPPSSISSRGRGGLSREKSAVEWFESIGYERHIVIKALEATTGDRGKAGHLMQRLADGKGMPDNEPGVWTEVDDANLKKVSEMDLDQEHVAPDPMRQKIEWAKGAKRKLEAKHGVEGCEKRIVFLINLEKQLQAKARVKKGDWKKQLLG